MMVAAGQFRPSDPSLAKEVADESRAKTQGSVGSEEEPGPGLSQDTAATAGSSLAGDGGSPNAAESQFLLSENPSENAEEPELKKLKDSRSSPSSLGASPAGMFFSFGFRTLRRVACDSCVCLVSLRRAEIFVSSCVFVSLAPPIPTGDDPNLFS